MFNFYMKEFKYIGADMGLDPIIKYDYPGAVDFFNILTSFNEKNFMDIKYVPNFKSELLRLWKILTFYFPFFLSWKFCFALITYFQSMKGLYMKNVQLLPLNETYYPVMTHLVNIKPPNVIKSANMSRHENEFSTSIDRMSVDRQKDLIHSIVNQKILLF